jgi:hypothetical protein
MPPRALGLLPAAFFAAAAAHNLAAGTPQMLLWVCNLANVLLAVGLAAAWPLAIWIATLWLLLGVPLWGMDAIVSGELLAHSFFTHVAAAVVGVLALRRTPRPQRALWWRAVLFGIGGQLAARLLSAPADNINVAFAPYHALAGVFPPFPAGWALNIAAFALLMAALEFAAKSTYRNQL